MSVHVALVPATDEELALVARRLARMRVDPLGVDDHDWLHGDSSEVAKRLRDARDRRTAARGVAWVVYADDEPGGYISAKIDRTEAETFSVVAADVQGRGIGRAAREAALEALMTLGVKTAISVARPESASSRISRRIGYQPAGSLVRTSPTGEEVTLERYELDLSAWMDERSRADHVDERR
jgi:GNAT superfamily N-acetyltransferase